MSPELRHALPLWLLAPVVLWLATHRPEAGRPAREGELPAVIAGHRHVGTFTLDEAQITMLGTDDAEWRTYEGPDGAKSYVIAVFHREDWKSIHPPLTCLLGSNMELIEEGEVPVRFNGGTVNAGRLLLQSRADGSPYLSLYVYLGQPDLVSGDYSEFFWFHAPKALVRRSSAGCLLRIDRPLGSFDQVGAADRELVQMLEDAIPRVGALLVHDPD